MIKTLAIIVIYLKMCTCSWPIVYYDISQEILKKYPWMVTIENATSWFGYGSLIHRRAVLTYMLTYFESPLSSFDFHVYAECYWDDTLFTNQDCAEARNVSELYYTSNNIEANENDYRKNLAILILSKPFELSEKLNVINLSKNRFDFNRDSCAILSLRSVKSSDPNHVPQYARFFSTISVNISKEQVNIKYGQLSNLTTLNDLGQLESFENYRDSSLEMFFDGGPVVCKSIENNDRWLQIGIADLTMKNQALTNTLVLTGKMFRINYYAKKGFNEIINEFRSYNQNIKN